MYRFQNNRNQVESEFLARVIDSALPHHGASAALSLPYIESILRRFVALRIADKQGDWQVANEVLDRRHDTVAPDMIMEVAHKRVSRRRKHQQNVQARPANHGYERRNNQHQDYHRPRYQRDGYHRPRHQQPDYPQQRNQWQDYPPPRRQH